MQNGARQPRNLIMVFVSCGVLGVVGAASFLPGGQPTPGSRQADTPTAHESAAANYGPLKPPREPTDTPTPTATATSTSTPTSTPTATAVPSLHFTGFGYPSCPYGWPPHTRTQSCEDWGGGIRCNWHLTNGSGSFCTTFTINFTDSRPSGAQTYYYVTDSDTTGYFMAGWPWWQLTSSVVYSSGPEPAPGEGPAHKSGSIVSNWRTIYVQDATKYASDWDVTFYLGAVPVPPTLTPTLTPSSTASPLPTFTPSSTPSPTPTATNTATTTPTRTSTPAGLPTWTPVAKGNCWAANATWEFAVNGYMLGNISDPEWIAAIDTAATTWSNAGTTFTLIRYQSSNNIVSIGAIPAPYDRSLAVVYPELTSDQVFLARTTEVFNQGLDWDATEPISAGFFSLENIATHEFGHWVFLQDISKSGCREVTMYYQAGPEEVNKETLEGADVEGLYWAYPTPR